MFEAPEILKEFQIDRVDEVFSKHTKIANLSEPNWKSTRNWKAVEF